ncbi:MAG: type II toxin-antitoxin system HicB family antitoxin [Candidatus Lindowbacteria bacterium]|nr:type II toxin-antitoxin system HicB family antitoxin [Candidatus Lindowbacteria bacterium]
MKLNVHIEQDEAGYFLAEVPALPGCLSQGKTREEAIKNIREAIESWLEVMESKTQCPREELIEVIV